MSLRFRFTFRGHPIEIVPADLAAANPHIRRLRAHLMSRAGRHTALADWALAGFIARCMRLYGEEYVTRVMEALERIHSARTTIENELERALRGELPDFQRMRGAFSEIDDAMPNVIAPEHADPPRISPEIVARGGGGATAPPATLSEFLGQLGPRTPRLSAAERALLETAEAADPRALRALLTAETESTLRAATGGDPARPFNALMEAVRGRMSEADAEALMGTIRRLNARWRESGAATPEGRLAHVEAAIEALGTEGLPNLGWLQRTIRANPNLQALLMSHPDQLRLYWLRYRSRPRPYGFARYVWFNMHHVRGAIGEWTAAFDLGRGGLMVFLKGPKPEVTAAGTDLVMLDVSSGEIWVIDNKAVRARVLDRVSALMRNFPDNLRNDIAEFRAAAGDQPPPRLESLLRNLEIAEQRIRRIVDLLPEDPETRRTMLDSNAEVTLPNGERRPVQTLISEILQEHRIHRAVTEAGGKLEALSRALEEAGIELERLHEALPEGDVE